MMSDITKIPPTQGPDAADGQDWRGPFATIRVGDDIAAAEADPALDSANLTPEQEDAAAEADLLAPAPRPSMGDWFRARTLDQWFFFGIFMVAAVLRFWGLADKPLHHDESLHAYYSWQFLINPSGYQYNPLLHGPFQFHIIPFFYVMGSLFHLANNGINDFMARMLPALMGLAMVPMPYFLRHQLGRWGAIAASLVLAVSPSFVYYSRFVRDDIYVTCFTLLIVVAAIQYSQTQRVGWLLTGAAALVLSFTAMENTFFTIAVFGSFFIALVLWDLGLPLGKALIHNPRWQSLAGGLVLLVPAAVIGGGVAYFGLIMLGKLSQNINTLTTRYKNTPTDPRNPDVVILNWEATAFLIAVIICLVVCLVAVFGLVKRLSRNDAFVPAPRWHRWVDPQRQPVLETLLGTDWVRWFLAFVVGVLLFAAFFTDLPSHWNSLAEWSAGIKNGVGRGMLQGIYYWLEQQQVQRGGQPWYYYLILIPLYEPLILVFGLAGVLRALVHPTRFRLFLVFWFTANIGLYSWAGEKMPWLVIHILLPLILLAGTALDWAISAVIVGARTWWRPTRALVGFGAALPILGLMSVTVASTMFFVIVASVLAVVALGLAFVVEQFHHWQMMRRATRQPDAAVELTGGWGYGRVVVQHPPWYASVRQIVAVGSLALAVLLLVPTVWNMQRVSFYDPSVAPNEMLVYVQTTTAVQRTMDKIDALDRQLYHGKHKLKIAVTADGVWPFVWYLNAYPGVFDSKGVWQSGAYINYTASDTGPRPDVIIGGLSDGSQNIPDVFPNEYA
ncbi:MAG: TIGR03663 family protein, partial [Ktedonobacterales bacterium]|nr:TIGR03663 family protein [Ktedonobacterales bacterium]